MVRRLYFFLNKVAYSFPVQLLLNNLQRNHTLMICWAILFAMVTGAFGKYMGVPYLFLDPEYLHQVNFTSFFIIGLCTAGFTTAFHITCYINDGHRFTFIGTLPRPFTKFAINNSVIPLAFIGLYVYQVVRFQLNNEYSTPESVAWNVSGLVVGYLFMTGLFAFYFYLTNKDIFKYVVCQIDERIKSNVKMTRASAMKKLEVARKKQVRVDYYLDGKLRPRKVERQRFYDRATVLQVFDQNHFNLVIIELFIFALVIILGIFKDYEVFQLPAASSFMILLTIFVMLAGAFSYWFGNWAATSAMILFLFINHLAGEDFFTKRYEAFGIDYNRPAVEYSADRLKILNDSAAIQADWRATLPMLENWKKKFGEGEKPKMVFLCASGGGKRAALWTFTALQTADSITGGNLFKQSILITGASGGLIGASFYRELKLRNQYHENVRPYAAFHRQSISSDNLNPLIFGLLANDLFVGFTKFQYGGNLYSRDRGYTFEEQLNQITEGYLDKTINAYDSVELQAKIPMMIFTPTIVNDGRKLYIGSRPVSFLNMENLNFERYDAMKQSGVDFHRLFAGHGGENLRFLSAMRMSATFPYITPNTTLPTSPELFIMDAGISDNFGLSDAVRFLYAYREWIAENTSGVIILSIRDSNKLGKIPERKGQNIIDAFTQPISSVYNNFENFQDIAADLQLGQAHSWFRNSIDRVDLEYEAEDYAPILQKMDSIRKTNARASLSWRLTSREKQSIIDGISTYRNRSEIERLRQLLEVR